MASDATQLRELASLLRKEAAEFEAKRSEKVAALLQASHALVVLKEKLTHVR